MNNAPQGTQATQASEYAPIDTLRADPRNARLHGDRNLDAVVASLRRFGQQKPIVVLADGTVIAGNATLEAARRLGWTHLWVARSTLSDTDAMAYAIADNRTAELAEWDWEVLRDQLATLTSTADALGGEPFDLADLGWAPHEAVPLLRADFDAESASSVDAGVRPITVTQQQREVFERAVARFREQDSTSAMTEGRVVELLAEAYLA